MLTLSLLPAPKFAVKPVPDVGSAALPVNCTVYVPAMSLRVTLGVSSKIPDVAFVAPKYNALLGPYGVAVASVEPAGSDVNSQNERYNLDTVVSVVLLSILNDTLALKVTKEGLVRVNVLV